MNDPLGLVAAARRTGIAGLTTALRERAVTWLPTIQPERTLAEPLETAVERWPDTGRCQPGPVGPVVYPILYRDRPRITPGQFCEITDAAHEAARKDSSVVLVAVPLGRSGGGAARGMSTARLADCWQAVGLPVHGAPALVELPDVAGELVDQARINGFARRSVDLPDLLVAAAARCTHASAVYLPRGLARRRGLDRMPCLAPLSTLCGVDPFGDPPSTAKLRPAGSDPLWFLSFTTCHTDQVALASGDREKARQAMRVQLGRCWNLLRAAGAAASDETPAAEPIRLRLSSPPSGYEGPSARRAILPLFGSPRLAEATRTFIRTAAAVVADLTVMVDDLSPRYLYPTHDPADARRRWQDAAAQLPVNLRFLSDQEPVALAEALTEALARLRGADVLAAAPAGLGVRVRGRHTGYDAIHLATMAVAAASSVPALLVVRGSNLGAALRFGSLMPVAGLLVATGLDTETPPRGPVSLLVEPFSPREPGCLSRREPEVVAG